MTARKPVTDKAILLYYDYAHLFNMQTDAELGKTIRLLLQYQDEKNPPLNPTGQVQIDNVYNYIMGRIIDYKQARRFYVEKGKEGGSPLLSNSYTLKGALNPTVNLKEKKRKENKINKKIKQKSFSGDENNLDEIVSPKIKKTKSNLSSNLEKMPKHLAQTIKMKKKVKISSKQLSSWQKEFEKLLDTFDQDRTTAIKRVIVVLKWYRNNFQDKFCPVIESGKSFREKFLRLEAAMERAITKEAGILSSKDQPHNLKTFTKSIENQPTEKENLNKFLAQLKEEYVEIVKKHKNCRDEYCSRVSSGIGGPLNTLPFESFRDLLHMFTSYLKDTKSLPFEAKLYNKNWWPWKQFLENISNQYEFDFMNGKCLKNNAYGKFSKSELENLKMLCEEQPDLPMEDDFDELLQEEYERNMAEELSEEEERKAYEIFGKFQEEEEE